MNFALDKDVGTGGGATHRHGERQDEGHGARSQALCTLAGAHVRIGLVPALQDVNLSIYAGERVALIGSNGSGKSTLLRLIHGLAKPTQGLAAWPSPKRLAMLFQRPYMLRASCQNNVALGLWLRGTGWQQAKALALPALHRVGLGDLARRNAKTLSGGQQQRLALARAWALAPEVLLLDEPTASLDPHAKREVEALLAELTSDMTVVFASHNMGQVKRLASRVIYLERGRVLADLPTAQFFDGDVLKNRFPQAHLFVKGEMS